MDLGREHKSLLILQRERKGDIIHHLMERLTTIYESVLLEKLNLQNGSIRKP